MKSNFSIIFFCCFFIVSCHFRKTKKEIEVTNDIPSSFKMYEISEMALLMRKMLDENSELRKKLLLGEDIGSFNSAYLKIHTAKLTDSSDFDATYATFAKHFITMQKDIYSVNEARRKAQFNNAINACVACHQDRCTGPIPKIKKLLIP